MEGPLAGKRLLVLGGWGLVGSAVCRELLQERPAALLVHSLRLAEAEEAVRELHEAATASGTTLVALHGDVFLPADLGDRPGEDLARDAAARRRLLDETYAELSPAMLAGATLFRLLHAHRPHAIVDCVNTATALAYQDVYAGVRRVRELLPGAERASGGLALAEAVEAQLAVLELPRLIRHVQLLFESMVRCGTETYLKVGTTGTGGMGLNVPYTHSEERPSRLLLSKAGLAGAHSMLLFLMGNTPGAPVVKEVKPAAAVAWKRIARGPVLRRGRPIPLYDCPPDAAAPAAVAIRGEGAWHPLGGAVLEAAFIDTGENGMFSLEEFETVSALGQMEFVTAEEIARYARIELHGAATGREVVGALAGACLPPSYRAGVLRQRALEALAALDSEEAPSVAFEMLGPPRLSKLLYEAHLLSRVCRVLPALPEAEPQRVSAHLAELLGGAPELRARILSIGIPILLPEGRLLRGPEVKTPAAGEAREGPATPEDLERWARAGWVDLRVRNVALWQERLRRMRPAAREARSAGEPAAVGGSGAVPAAAVWEGPRPYSPGKLAAWIFANEDGGARLL